MQQSIEQLRDEFHAEMDAFVQRELARPNPPGFSGCSVHQPRHPDSPISDDDDDDDDDDEDDDFA
ncbi:hypothetical protein AXF42_Ash014028 [Apostasia shenzhenica]|uniref:Uncharacterized protein n=1 Tax=Apostasia shenzhenica TaxID=1088818 RepID=A0A2I0A981_9ASPA|nr:hypothetical protein AXF42_Ash014028 [Apostasia shenzhenica]